MFFKQSQSSKKQSSKPSAEGQTNFEEKWQSIQKGVDDLVEFLGSSNARPFDTERHMKLYTVVYDLCTQKVDTGNLANGPTEILYDRYGKCINDYLKQTVVPALKNTTKENLLPKAVKRWRNHEIVVKWMGKLFGYLDRYYTKHNNRDSLRDVGLKCYQNLVYGSIKGDMARALLDKIYAERNGEIIDRAAIKDGVNLFIEMGLNSLNAYTKDFEEPLIKETEEFYRAESSKWINTDSCPEYMKKAEDRLLQEENRAISYLHHTTLTTLIKTAEKQLITEHADRLLNMENSGFLALLQDVNDKKEDLSRMYRLFRRVENLKPMTEMMRDHIRKEGEQIVNNHQNKEEIDFKSYVDSLLDLHEQYSSLVSEEFQKDSLFLEALKDAFTSFVNTDLSVSGRQQKTSTAELLSTYCDHLMKSTEKLGEEKLEELLEKVVRLFGYISDKDTFQEFYRRLLSKRLLVSSKSNDEAERSFITKLKMRCGASFTSKLEGMIKDKNVSEGLQQQFKDYCSSSGQDLSIDFSPKVLTTGFWPAFKIDELNIPEQMTQCVNKFKEFYDSKTESRTLTWVHSLGTCHIRGRYPCGIRELVMSEYQACIMLLFNEKESSSGDHSSELTVEDVQKSINLPFEDVRRNLLTLSVTKACQILISDAGSKSNLTPNDKFRLNTEFSTKKARIKIPNLVFKISSGERKDIDKTMEEERKHSIDAAIVRNMKARKTMSHQNLVVEVSKQLMQYFRPDPKFIKRRIEDLISREFLERDQDQSNIYHYKA